MMPYLQALVLGITWGVTFSLARLATEAGAHPLGLAFWQAAGGGLVLSCYALIRRRPPSLKSPMLLRYCIIGIVGTAIPGTILFYAAPHVPAGVLAITVALVPITTYAASWLMGVDFFSPLRLTGVVLGFVAILLVMFPESSLPSPNAQLWVLIALIAVCFYTAENLYVDKYIPPATDMALLLMGGMFAAAAILAPLVISQDAFVPISLPFDIVDLSIISMSLVSSIAYLMYLSLIQSSGAVFASMSAYVITIAGVFWGIVFFAESHAGWIWSALALMLVAMALVKPRNVVDERTETSS